jgi:hypothetical protein
MELPPHHNEAYKLFASHASFGVGELYQNLIFALRNLKSLRELIGGKKSVKKLKAAAALGPKTPAKTKINPARFITPHKTKF